MNYFKIVLIIISISVISIITHKIDSASYEKKLLYQVREQLAHEQQIVDTQSKITKEKQGERDAIQNRYDALMSQYNGMRNKYGKLSKSYAPVAIPSQGVRLYGPDAEFLITFARNCAITELERNEVIQKYDSLNS